MDTELRAIYRGGPGRTFLADTCAPLRDAAARGALKLDAYGRGSYPGEPIEADALPQLASVGRWEATSDQDWGLDWHRNEGIELTCVTAGAVAFSCENDEFDLVAGDVTITRPWQRHRIGRPLITASTLTWLIIDVGVRRPNQEWKWPPWLPIPRYDLDRLTELLSHNEQAVWRSTTPLRNAVTDLDSALCKRTTQPLARIGTATARALIEFRELLEQGGQVLNPYLSSTERTVRWFLDHLTERIHESWTVDKMANECGIGRTRFASYCKQMCNQTPLNILTNLRLQRALEMLTQSDMRISEIAQRCGFQSSQYFATVFRKRFGKQPLEMRASSCYRSELRTPRMELMASS